MSYRRFDSDKPKFEKLTSFEEKQEKYNFNPVEREWKIKRKNLSEWAENTR